MRKIESDAELRDEIAKALGRAASEPGFSSWIERIVAHLATVRAGLPERLHEAAFIKDLFDSPAITSSKLGNINVAPAVNDQQFRRWFAEHVEQVLAIDVVQRKPALATLYAELKKRLPPLLGAKTPKLKILRALAALFPENFTTIASVESLSAIHRALGGGRGENAVAMNLALRARLDPFIQPLASESAEHLQARRMAIPWLFCEQLAAGETKAEPKKIPGLTPFKDRFKTVLRVLEKLKDSGSFTAQQFDEVLQAGYEEPIQSSSLTTMRRAIEKELDLCERRGESYYLSERGANLVATRDPDALKDHLLKRVVGVDHVVNGLKQEPMSRSEVLALLRQAHPAWTTDFIPSSVYQWLTALDVIELVDRQMWLTERGKRWAQDITWEPSFPKVPLGAEAEQDDEADTDPISGLQPEQLVVPPFGDFWERMQQVASETGLSFPEQAVAQLHAGLWLDPVRHFAVLAGISGSGKTQLAMNYALALCGDSPKDLRHIKVIAVQPGWYDQTPLVGHVSPLHESTYRSTPFLELLQEASSNPAQPYVAILDEMNLSHPEQYMAQLLSGMELQEHIELHSIEEESSGVPSRILYPANLVLIGTVNMDETTHGLSDKVLDRAFTMEFMQSPIGEHPAWSEANDLPEPARNQARTVLVALSEALAPCRLNFGRRTEADVIGYLKMRGPKDGALDEVVYAKVLPKLRGEDSPQFNAALTQVLSIVKAHGLQACTRKVESLLYDLSASGSARFWR